jgi:2-oxoglutarate ferredoxin oxidoreductase subunit beta
MTYFRPNFRHPELPKNALGYDKRAYEGALSTLCAGCGHDSISAAIAQACFELPVEPHRVAKLSGIGCSSKTPAYYLGRSHGFNSVHGRMPSVATGANMANRDLIYIGVSGDGDTASIGMGQFMHVVRRNLNMVYVVMNNGCYGLTKGQDSATADRGSVSKKGTPNPFESFDLCALAIQAGATFVARSFSGDKRQLVPLLKAAMHHHGLALIDVISPCVTFNNTPNSTKSYDWVRDHMEATGTIDLVPPRETITLEQTEGTVEMVQLHDGAQLALRKAAPDLDVRDRLKAIQYMEACRRDGEIATGLLYLDENSKDTHDILNTVEVPLSQLSERELCPGMEALAAINEAHR